MREILIVGAIGLGTILMVLFVAAPVFYACERLLARRVDQQHNKSKGADWP